MKIIEPIYPISPSNLDFKNIEKWFKSLLDQGAKFLQYREKEKNDFELFSNSEKLLKICESYKATLVINDRADIAYILNAKCLHIGDKDIPFCEVKKLLGKKPLIGVSTHSYKEAKFYFSKSPYYIALGPIFQTTTKENPHPIVPIKTQKKVIKESPHPVVAIGGITLSTAEQLWQRGFSSISAISIFKENGAKTYKELLRIYQSLQF